MTIQESYKILGLNKDATKEQIEVAYKELIKLYHPDTYKGDKDFATEKTMQIVTAYRVLTLKESASTKQTTYSKKQQQDAKRHFQQAEKLNKKKQQYEKIKQQKQQEKQQRKQEVKDIRTQRTENKQQSQPVETDQVQKPKFSISTIETDYIVVAVLVVILIVLLTIFANL